MNQISSQTTPELQIIQAILADIRMEGFKFTPEEEALFQEIGLGNIAITEARENVSFMEKFKPLNQDELAVIEKARKAISEIPSIPCTACEYCVKGCPQNIPIPNVFATYNRKMIYE